MRNAEYADEDNLEPLANLTTRVKGIGEGGYSRLYVSGGKQYRSAEHMMVAELLDSLGVRYRVNEPLFEGSKLKADFVVGGRKLVILERDVGGAERAEIARGGRSCVVLLRSSLRRDVLDNGIRFIRAPEGLDARRQTIFLDDPSFNFDYAHILPKTEKCSVMHGHTSEALIEIAGEPKDGMVVDFNDAKPAVRDAIRDLDHKLFINKQYIVSKDRNRVRLAFETVHGRFEIAAPIKTTVLMDGEATVENLALELLRRIVPRMPRNVDAVGVYVYEGLNKGTHLLAKIHRDLEEDRSRNR